MAIFRCPICDRAADSDDGCIEDPIDPTRVICTECEMNAEDIAAEKHTTVRHVLVAYRHHL